jgi:hypothetical protein
MVGQIAEKVEGVLTALATKVEARLVLPPIFLSSQFFKKAAPSVRRPPRNPISNNCFL